MAAKRILVFAPFGAWTVHHQLDAVFGAGLSARGAEVLVLGCDGLFADCVIAGNPRNPEICANCAHAGASLFPKLGLRVLQLRQVATREDHEAAAETVAAANRSTPEDLRYGSYPVGEWSLASMQGYFATANLDMRNEKIARPMLSQLSNGVLLIRVLQRMLEEFRPDHLICFSAVQLYYRIAFELARERNIPVLVHERGLLNDSFGLLDSENMNSNDGRFGNWEPWKRVPLTQEQCLEVKTYFREREEGKNSFSRFYDFKSEGEILRETLRIPKGARIVALLPSGDRELGAYEATGPKTFTTQLEWIRATVEICRKHDLYLVVRHHPSNVQKNQVNHSYIGKMLALSRELPDRVRFVMPHEKLTSYSLLWNADLAITYFSTIGSEALVRGIPGICVGNSLFWPMGIDWVQSPDAYEKAILAGLEKAKGLGVAELSQAYRFAHYLVFKLGYAFKTFGIKDTHGSNIRVRNVSELLPGNDPIFDRVCDHILKGTSLFPVPESADRDRGDAEERAFLEKESEELRRHRKALADQVPAPRPAGPVITVLVPGAKKASVSWESSLSRSREKSVQILAIDLNGDFAAACNSIRKALDRAEGRYVYIARDGVDIDESVFSRSVDFLDQEKNAEFQSLGWGAWLTDARGGLHGELFTEAKPVASYEEVLELWPDLEDPMGLFTFNVMRTDFLRELADWLQAMDGFSNRDIAASIFGLFHGTKCKDTVHHFAIPMLLIRPIPAVDATIPLMPIQVPEAPTSTKSSFGPSRRSQKDIEDELNVHIAALSRDAVNRDAVIGCVHALTALGDGYNARRIIGSFLEVFPKDDGVRKLLDSVEWNSRKGLASLAELKLRGAGYARLKSGKPFESYSEAEQYVQSVPGWMLEGQEKFLFDKVKSLPDGAVVLEMGADRGRSTSAMALACVGTGKRIYSIDTFAGNSGLMGEVEDYYHDWLGNLKRLGLDCYVTGLQGYTFDVLPTWKKPVDFTFIDASHEYIDVLNDLRLIYPHVKKGGWIAFHDVEPGWPGSWRVWLEYGIPLLSNHEVVHTLACGRKSQGFDFGKKPDSIPEFSFARNLIDDLKRSGDPSAAPLLPSLSASLDFTRSGAGGRRMAVEAESAIARMAPQLKQTLNSMVAKDAFLDGYLHYWLGLALEAEGRREDAMKEFANAAKVSYAVPMELLQHRLGSAAASPGNGSVEIFRSHIAPGDTVIQFACGDGSLLRELPGRLKLGLETDDQLRKHASVASGIDEFSDVSELPAGFADVVIGHSCLSLVPDPLSLLKSLRAKLKATGRAVFTAPVPDSSVSDGAGMYSWTPATLRNLFSAAGFAVREAKVVETKGAGRLVKIVAECTPSDTSARPDQDWVKVKEAAADLSIGGAKGKMDPRDIPVALVAYRRPDHTRRVLESLERHGVRNLYVFCDAAKGNGDEANVRETRRLVEGIGWTKPEIQKVESNRGLAKSVMAATDLVLSRHETVVLLEDDCVPHRHFFDFMASTLDKYRDDEKVFGVSGYTVPMQPELLKRYPHDVYFCPRISSWGWATWRRAWKQLDRDLISVCKKALAANIDLDQGGNDIRHSIEGMLQGHVKDVWTLPWVLSVYVNRGVFVYPTVSHIDNIGMDGTGVHCGKTDKYLTVLAEAPARRFPDRVFLDPEVMARFRSFYDLVLQRG